MYQQASQHFTSLFVEFSNVHSEQSAQRVIKTISHNLEICLPDESAQRFFALVPSYLKPQGKVFYHRRPTKPAEYSQSTLYNNLKTQLSYTDTQEVQTVLQAYFASLEIVCGQDGFDAIIDSLPKEMKHLET